MKLCVTFWSVEMKNIDSLQISLALLKEIVNFFGKFNKIFDKLEISEKPTLQNVIPTYYLIVSDVCADANTDSDSLRFLKRNVIAGMNEKYWLGNFIGQQCCPTKFVHVTSKIVEFFIAQLLLAELAHERFLLANKHEMQRCDWLLM